MAKKKRSRSAARTKTAAAKPKRSPAKTGRVKTRSRKTTQNRAAAQTAKSPGKKRTMANEDLSATNLEQIRKILIGDHTAESRARIKKLEETLTRELANLRTEVFKRLDAMELKGKKERDELDKALQAKVTQGSDTAARAQRQLRDQQRAELKQLREETGLRHVELAEECEAGLEELRAEAVGKEELSGFLGDIALQLVDRKQIRRT